MRTTSRAWAVTATVLLIATIGVAALGLRQSHRTHELSSQRSFAPAQQVMKAAASATTALLTYSYQTVEKDVAAAKDLITGDFRDKYSNFTSAVVIPKAREKQVSVKATALGTGIQSLTADHATVLVFINQSTTSAANPEGQETASSAVVGLDNVDGAWKIATFDQP